MPELRKKILYTLFILLIFRFGSCIPVPFINTELLATYFEQSQVAGSMLGYLDMFTGGGLSNATIFAMSITPYINASIILQLLTVAIPALERMVKEGGEEGRKRIASWTRYVAVVLGLLQGFSYYALLRSNGFLSNTSVLAAAAIILTFTAGTALIMWLGEHITQNGIGNGISIILFAGIVSRGPSLIRTLYNLFKQGGGSIISALLMIVIGLAVVVFIVFMSNAERRIPVQYAKRVVGRKMYGGQSTHIPLKINASGVLPLIFASAIMQFPATIFAFFPNSSINQWWNANVHAMSWGYQVIFALLIIAFTFFYSSISFNPVEIAKNMQQNGGMIPGIRQGKPTSDFILKISRRITLFGALFLALLAVLPTLIYAICGVSLPFAASSLLIAVSVAMETMRQLESQMTMRHYKGFLN